MRIPFRAQTDLGIGRITNDDFHLAATELGLFVVCDGASSKDPKEKSAAEICAQSIRQVIDDNSTLLQQYYAHPTPKLRNEIAELLRRSILFANTEVYSRKPAQPTDGTATAKAKSTSSSPTSEKLSRGSHSGSTTVDAVLFVKDHVVFAHVGDSRVYLIREGQTHLLTQDHLVSREMVQEGVWTKEQAEKSPYGNVLTRAIGLQTFVKPDVLSVEVMKGDRFVLCTDGVSRYLQSPKELSELSANQTVEELSQKLMTLIKERNSKDNATVLCFEVPVVTEASVAQSTSDKVSANEKERLIKQVPLFRYLTYVELAKVIEITRTVSFPQGETLIREGSQGDEMFVLVSGSVEVTKSGVKIATRGAGEFLGEIGMFNNAPRSATLVTTQATTALVLGRKDLLPLLRSDPNLAVKFLWALNQELNKRVFEMTSNLASSQTEMHTSADFPFQLIKQTD